MAERPALDEVADRGELRHAGRIVFGWRRRPMGIASLDDDVMEASMCFLCDAVGDWIEREAGVRP